jgi:FkbM family methyltransferase
MVRMSTLSASPLLGRVRRAGSLGLLTGLSVVGRLSGRPTPAGMHRIAVMGGPLRGQSLAVTSLTRASFATGGYQAHVLAAMRAHVRAGDVTYDLGAHVGYFTLVLAGLTGPGGRVFSFEPDPRNLEALRANVQDCRTPIVIVPAAVSDAAGQVDFATFELSSIGHIADSRTPANGRRVTVPCTTLDHHVYEGGNPPPAFVKIDVEGAETRVLSGARRVLGQARPVVVVEVRGPERWREVRQLAEAAGYEAEVIGGGVRGLSSAGYGDALLIPKASA